MAIFVLNLPQTPNSILKKRVTLQVAVSHQSAHWGPGLCEGKWPVGPAWKALVLLMERLSHICFSPQRVRTEAGPRLDTGHLENHLCLLNKLM